MLAKLRRRHGTVVAYLALFIALGGVSYAAATVTSRQIKNRSIKAIDVGRNQLTGKEIKESKLGVVPQALHAQSADSSTSATSAVSAVSAVTAVNAAKATDADHVGGADLSSLKVNCPSGTILAAGACVETANRLVSPAPSVTWLVAEQACEADNRRLPLATELMAARTRGVAIDNAIGEWTANAYQNGATFSALQLYNTGANGGLSSGTIGGSTAYYRCATSPRN